MKTSVNLYEFRANERLQRNFTFHGLVALFEWFEDYEEDTGEEIEFDPVAICCEFADYSSFEEVKGDYPDLKDLEELEENTIVIPHEQGLIIQKY